MVKILIVDDEKEILSVLEELLEEHHYHVIRAESAKDALTVLSREQVDLVVTDLVMPGMNGLSLTRAIIDINPHIPVIVMTAYASIEYAVESMKAGALDFISKPLKLNHTLFIIEKALETHRLKELADKSVFYKKLSNIDEMTGVHNHRFFKQMLKNEIERHQRYGRQLTLLMADIDDFKRVNDTFGHPVGDHVLRTVAELMKKSIRGCDWLSRYGGEEFTVILPETSDDEALQVAERIVTTICSHPFKDIEGEFLGSITITVGLASFPKDADGPDQLLNRADRALYQGKDSGKNQVTIFK